MNLGRHCRWSDSFPFLSGLKKTAVFWADQHQFSRSVMSNSLWPPGLQHARPPCPSPPPRVHWNSRPSSWWCHPTISSRLPCPSSTPRAWSNSCPLSQLCHPSVSSSVVPFSSCLQSFPASGSFPMHQVFASGGQSFGVSTSVLSMNIQDWFSLGLTSLISLQLKGLSRAFSSITIWRHQFFCA